MTLGFLLVFASSIVALLVGLFFQRRRNRRLLPPGPAKLPLIGNLLTAPTEYQWVKYDQWAREYCTEIIHLQVVRTSIIVLNSLESAQEILNRRSVVSSSRPVGTMLNKLVGWDWNFGFIPYGNAWRERRQAFWQEFNPSKSFNHHPVQMKYVRQFIKRVLDDPSNYRHHCIYTPSSAIIEVAYGFSVLPQDDPTITISERALKHLHNVGITGTYLVDHIPALKYLPTWLPGTGFLRYAKVAYEETMDMINIPYARVRDQILRGDAPPSLITRAYARDESILDNAEKEQVIEDVASVAYVAGVDTTPSPIITFIAAMILFPTVQKKAQAEVDRVLGSTRLPTFEDKASLPYIQAVVWELLRWKPVVPLGLPHLLTSDTVHKGYFLPKGTTVFANVWAIMRDEKVFPQAHEFRPERFLTADGEIDAKLTEIVDIGFGFGRRICPGRFFARDTVFIWITSILAVFDVSAAKNENGEEIRPDLHMIPSSILTLPPFKCDIKPRSKEAERLIRDG